MTADEVHALVRRQGADTMTAKNDHGITLKEALVQPQRIPVIERTVQEGRLKDKVVYVWLVAQETSPDGYRIIMSEDGFQFGLASNGFPSDKHLCLVGWYGDLISAFVGM